MSRSYFLMVGGDLLLALVLFIFFNVLLITSVVQPDLLPNVDPFYLGIVCLVVIGSKYAHRLYAYFRRDRQEFMESLDRILLVTILPVILVIFFVAAGAGDFYPTQGLEITLVSFVFLQIPLIYRVSFPHAASRTRDNVMIFGAGPLAEKVTEAINDNRNKFNFCGYIRPFDHDGKVDSDNSADILKTIAERKISHIVIALSERRGVLPVREMFSCKLRGVEIIDAESFYEKVTGKLLVEHIRPAWFVFSKGFLITKLMFKQQRVVDVVASSILLLLTLPFFPLITLIIRLDSPGNIFFRQTRVGFKEQEFELIKFRTMRANAEMESGAVWASENDSRVTRVGGLMRKFRIDELPQLINVLKGEMSFIGPRPERPEFVENLNEQIPYYSRRHSVRPGLTGWAQIKYPYGASEEDALEKLRYDLYFIKNFSLLLQFKIILGTVRVVLFGTGGR